MGLEIKVFCWPNDGLSTPREDPIKQIKLTNKAVYIEGKFAITQLSRLVSRKLDLPYLSRKQHFGLLLFKL